MTVVAICTKKGSLTLLPPKPLLVVSAVAVGRCRRVAGVAGLLLLRGFPYCLPFALVPSFHRLQQAEDVTERLGVK